MSPWFLPWFPSFTYNSDHWRVAREDGLGITHFQFDKNNLLAELDDSHVVQVQYTNEPNEYGNVISQHTTADGESQFYAFDAPGSAIRLTDATMVVTDEYAYDAWGEALATTGTTHNPIRYIGKLGYYLDQELGTYHVRRRQYDQILARFRSEDPIRQEGGDNLYLYVGNDPVGRVDPEGLDWWPKPIVIDTSRGPKGWGAWPLWYGTVPQEITYTRLRGSYGQRLSAELLLADLRELQKFGAKVDMKAAIIYRDWLNEKITVTEMSDAEFQRTCRQAQDLIVLAADIGTGFIPIFNDIRDITEVLTGRNLITGEELTTLDKVLTVLSAIIPLVSGPMLRRLGRPAREALERLLSSLQRLKKKLRSLVKSGEELIERAIEKLGTSIEDIVKALDEKLQPRPQFATAGGGIQGLDTTCPTRQATCPVNRPTSANSSKIDGLGGAGPDTPKVDAPNASSVAGKIIDWAKILKQTSPDASDLGKVALELRKKKGISASRNVFVVEYTSCGKKNVVAFESTRAGHSEIAALKDLPADARVTRAYSDRTPCTSGSNCFDALNNDPRFADMTEFQYFGSWGDSTLEARLAAIVAAFQ